MRSHIVRQSMPLFVAIALGAALISGAARAAVEVQRVVSPGGSEAWLVEEHTVPLLSMLFCPAAIPRASRDKITMPETTFIVEFIVGPFLVVVTVLTMVAATP